MYVCTDVQKLRTPHVGRPCQGLAKKRKTPASYTHQSHVPFRHFSLFFFHLKKLDSTHLYDFININFGLLYITITEKILLSSAVQWLNPLRYFLLPSPDENHRHISINHKNKKLLKNILHTAYPGINLGPSG